MHRPTIITIICILGYLWILFTFPGVFSPETKKLGDWIPAIYGLIIAGTFISFIGIWNMKRWGVEWYISFFCIKSIFFVMTDQLGISSYIGMLFSIAFIMIFFFYYKKMSLNL
jgi:hypothetical protein